MFRTMKMGLTALIATATVVSAQAADKLGLDLGVYNPDNLSGVSTEWVSMKENGKGKAVGQQVLCFKKNQPTSANAAAGADVSGIAGTPVSSLDGLCFTIVKGTAGAGSPRWNIYLTDGTDADNDGESDITGVVFLGALAAGDDGCFTAEEIDAAVAAAGGSPTDTVKYLQIIVDEDTTATDGVCLKNISVNVAGDTTNFNAANSRVKDLKVKS